MLQDLRPLLKDLALIHHLPEKNETVWIRVWRLPASPTVPLRFGYLLRRRLDARRLPGEAEQIVEERLEELRLDKLASGDSNEDPLSWRTLNLGVLHRWFVERLLSPAS